MVHDNDNVLPLNRVEGFADHRALSHLKILARHVGIETNIFRNNYPDAANRISALIASHDLPGVEQMKADIADLARFFADIDGAVKNPSNGEQT